MNNNPTKYKRNIQGKDYHNLILQENIYSYIGDFYLDSNIPILKIRKLKCEITTYATNIPYKKYKIVDH